MLLQEKINELCKLNNVIELSSLNYLEYLEEKNETLDSDESKTLFELLRIALYKECK